jgi:hypothetical protein
VSEIWTFVHDNFSRLTKLDYAMLVAMAVLIAAALFAIFQWLYSTVLGNQEKVISLKNETIAEYERSLVALKAAREGLEKQNANLAGGASTLAWNIHNAHLVASRQRLLFVTSHLIEVVRREVLIIQVGVPSKSDEMSGAIDKHVVTLDAAEGVLEAEFDALQLGLAANPDEIMKPLPNALTIPQCDTQRIIGDMKSIHEWAGTVGRSAGGKTLS